MPNRIVPATLEREMPNLARIARLFSPRPAWVVGAGILAAFYITFVLISATDTRGNDDAGILWVYAKNVVDGNGLVYKPGEYVEGYSSFVYVLLLSAGLGLAQLLDSTLDPKFIYWISLALNISTWWTIIGILYRFLVEELDRRAAAVIAALIGSSPAIGYWVTSGMDTTLALLSQVLVWVWVVRLDRRTGTTQERAAAFALCAAMLLSLFARAEGFLWPLLGLCWLVVRGRHKQALRIAIVFGSVGAGYVAWRLWYYGYPLPNTYYAKMTGSLSERFDSAIYGQAWQVIFDAGFLLSVIAIFVGSLSRTIELVRSPKLFRTSPSDFELLAGAAWIGYFVYIGGDVYIERPMLVLSPLGLVVAARLIYPALKTVGSAAIAIALALTLTLSPLWSYYRPLAAKHQGDGLEHVGEYLKENYPEGTVALNLAGKIAYYSGLPCIDMLGLCDEFIAHSEQTRPFAVGHTKSGFGYALKRKPELVIVCPQVFSGDPAEVFIDDGYSVEDMRTIGYVPVLACNAVRWSAIEKIAGKPLSEFSTEELRDLIVRKEIDLLIFQNPNPTGKLPPPPSRSSSLISLPRF